MTVSDIVSVALPVGGGFTAIVGIYWRHHYKLKTHDKDIGDLCKRMDDAETRNEKTNANLEVLHKNLVKLMEHEGVEPVTDLFNGGNQ